MIPSQLLIHACSFEPYQGEGRTGPTYGPSQDVDSCYIDQRRKLVRSAAGEEVTSETTIYMNTPEASGLVEGSRVTYRGQSSRVLAVKTYDSPAGSLVEVNLE